jgi:hypothetical protein
MLYVCLWVTPFQLVSQLTNFLENLYACYATEEHTKAIFLLSTINIMLQMRKKRWEWYQSYILYGPKIIYDNRP